MKHETKIALLTIGMLISGAGTLLGCATIVVMALLAAMGVSP